MSVVTVQIESWGLAVKGRGVIWSFHSLHGLLGKTDASDSLTDIRSALGLTADNGPLNSELLRCFHEFRWELSPVEQGLMFAVAIAGDRRIALWRWFRDSRARYGLLPELISIAADFLGLDPDN